MARSLLFLMSERSRTSRQTKHVNVMFTTDKSMVAIKQLCKSFCLGNCLNPPPPPRNELAKLINFIPRKRGKDLLHIITKGLYHATLNTVIGDIHQKDESRTVRILAFLKHNRITFFFLSLQTPIK